MLNIERSWASGWEGQECVWKGNSSEVRLGWRKREMVRVTVVARAEDQGFRKKSNLPKNLSSHLND
jgi:hypothetical protein